MSDEDEDTDQEMKSSNNNAMANQYEFEQNLKQCRDALSQSPNDYTAHLNLVNCLSNIEHIALFRKSRDKMSKKFAIPPAVSINFINSEIEYLYYLSNQTQNSSPNLKQINVIIQLFKNAISDYCVDIHLWTNYLSFVFQFKSIITIDEIRKNIINSAVNSIGQHFYDGHKFWTLYREFETENLSDLVAKQRRDDTPEMEDINGDSDNDNGDDTDMANVSVSKQIEKIRKIWRKQIGILHYQIEDTYRNYQNWERKLFGQTNSECKDSYNQCKKMSQKYFVKFEKELLALAANVSDGYASMERVAFWAKYIASIRRNITHISHKSVLSLYERAILDCFLFESQWCDYIKYIKENNLKFEILSVCQRSVRNIPNSILLWLEYIKAMEWTEQTLESINECIFARFIFPNTQSMDLQKKYRIKKEEIITFGTDLDKYIQIGIAKCEYYRRRAKCAMSERYERINECKTDNNELINECERVFDEFENYLFTNANVCNNRWIPMFYTFFTDFLSRFVGNISKARLLWEKLITKRGKEWNLWVSFIEWESKFGELCPVKPSQKKIEMSNVRNENQTRFGQNNVYQIRHLYHRAIHVLDSESGLAYICEKLLLFERMCGDFQSLNDAQMRVDKKLKKEQIRKKKQSKKKVRFSENLTQHKSDTQNTVSENLTKTQKRQFSDPNFSEAKGSKEERTVFVVNFRKTMTRKDIWELFEKFGKLQSIKLPKDSSAKHKSKLRGFGYILYKTKESALECIKALNGQSIQGKVLRVERYRNRHSSQNTIYIRGLDKGMSESEAKQCITNVLNECGEIREIRLTKDRNNTLKGFAYVEFETKESVQKALECNNCVYQNNVIQILEYKSENERVHLTESSTNDKNKNKMDLDSTNDSSSERKNKFGNLGFKPRAIGHRKTKIKPKTNTSNEQGLNQNILNKSNKTQNDFRKLFNL